MHDHENTLLDVPVTDDQLQRDAFLFDEKKVLSCGDVLIRPGQEVDVLYLLVEGQIDMVRYLGESREERKSFRYLPGLDAWHPVFGRYFITRKPSSVHYLAMTDCKVQQITHETLRGKLYLSGHCVAVIRELLRCSDMPEGSFLVDELEKRFDLFRFPGFRIDDPHHLLAVDRVNDVVSGVGDDRSQLERVKDGLKMADREYVKYAQDMVLKLLGEEAEQDGETTTLGHRDAPRFPPTRR